MTSLEAKRTQFRKYLERSGVVDALSKSLIKLYEEQNKPNDAIRFVRKYMCESCPDDAMYDALKVEVEEANRTINRLEQELERMKLKVKLTPDEIAIKIDEGFKSLMEDEECVDSLLRKHLTKEICDELKKTFTPGPVEANLLDCLKSGFEHHASAVGVYAADIASYDVYRSLFDPIIVDYHGQSENASEERLQKDSDWGDIDEIENLDPDHKYIVSTRIRIARNLVEYPFFPKLTEGQLVEIEQKIIEAVESLDEEHAGVYLSLKDIDVDTQAEMVNRRILFRKGDEFLSTAGCYRFWPTGRGIFHNPAETFLVWVNEEDHMRIISMTPNGDIGDVYHRMVKGLRALEERLNFSHHDRYGFLTACPTNLGTTLRASVHIKLPLMAKNMERLTSLMDQLNLQIRGTGGEHTEIEDGIMDISNKRRLGHTEFELVKMLHDGIAELIKAEEDEELNE
ncbi:arginine kinase [Episyrphus balteatus]|uniref:arginine kinase n=1 Tax=Episyrphus balteatus TaxID=286459 RepID=UPI002485246B|nr:arginine kinase [Episyrphus balteatus]